MFDANWLYMTVIMAPPLLLSLTVHEFAHARTALAFGDPTAKHMGRCSLNPLVHLDPFGTIVLLVTHFIGWAKPVPVNPANMHPRRLGEIMVSLAGPLSNLSLAVIFGLALRALVPIFDKNPENAFLQSLFTLLLFTTMANLAWFAFNLIPLFPLDGHHIVRELLPTGMQRGFMGWQIRFGRILLLVLIFGPKLFEIATRRPAPIDPIGLIFDVVIHPAVGLIFTSL